MPSRCLRPATVLAFGFMSGGGFALSDHRSFDLAILHRFIHVLASMARQTYRHIDYSAITLAAGENWTTLSAAVTAPRPSSRIISVIPAASPAPRHRHKNASTPATIATAPRPSRKVTPSIVVVTPDLGYSASLKGYHLCCSCCFTSASDFPLRKAKKRIKKAGPVSRRTTRLNC
ncbi:hypothetical protein ACLOJK_024147 [Asimina triloba]